MIFIGFKHCSHSVIFYFFALSSRHDIAEILLKVALNTKIQIHFILVSRYLSFYYVIASFVLSSHGTQDYINYEKLNVLGNDHLT